MAMATSNTLLVALVSWQRPRISATKAASRATSTNRRNHTRWSWNSGRNDKAKHTSPQNSRRSAARRFLFNLTCRHYSSPLIEFSDPHTTAAKQVRIARCPTTTSRGNLLDYFDHEATPSPPCHNRVHRLFAYLPKERRISDRIESRVTTNFTGPGSNRTVLGPPHGRHAAGRQNVWSAMAKMAPGRGGGVLRAVCGLGTAQHPPGRGKSAGLYGRALRTRILSSISRNNGIQVKNRVRGSIRLIPSDRRTSRSGRKPGATVRQNSAPLRQP